MQSIESCMGKLGNRALFLVVSKGQVVVRVVNANVRNTCERRKIDDAKHTKNSPCPI